MLTEEEYKKEYLEGKHQTDYNHCRFADNKIEYALEWLKKFKPNINIDLPKNIVDRINLYKIYDKNPLKQLWSDKIIAIELLKQKGMKNIIIPTIWSKYTNKFTIDDYKEIPDGKLIFKCNHGSGWNYKFTKTPTTIKTNLMNKLNTWLSLNYAYIAGWEWQYNNIKPGILVQKDLSPGNTILDWCFWCENGNIFAVQVTKKAAKNIQEFLYFTDESGNKPKYYIGYLPTNNIMDQKRKTILEQIKPYAKELAKGFKFVRIDFFYINNKVYFGEMTFSPCSGILNIGYFK